MKLCAEFPYADKCLIGKPVRVDGTAVGRVVSVDGNQVVSEIDDTELCERIRNNELRGYSIGICDHSSRKSNA